jgi:hypothetical protein
MPALFVQECRFDLRQANLGSESLSVCDHGDCVSLSATWYSQGAGFSIYFPKNERSIVKLEELVAVLKRKPCSSCGRQEPCEECKSR